MEPIHYCLQSTDRVNFADDYSGTLTLHGLGSTFTNIGHFDNEIDMDGISRIPGIKKLEVKPQVHEWQLPNGNSVLILSEGRLMNLGNATGHPSFVMSTSFSNQVLAQIELFTKRDEYPIGVYILPKHLASKYLVRV